MLKPQRLLARRPLEQPRKQSLRALKPRDRARIRPRRAGVLATRGLPITIHQRQRRLAHRAVSLPGADEQVQQIRSHAITSVSRSEKDITPLTFAAAHRESSRNRGHSPARKRRPTRHSPDKSGLSTHYKRPAPKPKEALATLLRSDAVQLELGQVFFRSTTQAELARTYELLGDRDAARSAIELAEQLTAPEDAVNYAITHTVRAQLALADNDRDVAERWARSAVDHAQRTDFPEHQADAMLELARVLAALGRREETIAEVRAALAVSEAKGDRPRAGKARALLEEFSDRA